MRFESEDYNNLTYVIHNDKSDTFISPGGRYSFGIASIVQKSIFVKLLVFAQAVETPVINSSSFQNNPHPDDYTIRTKVDKLQCAFEDFQSLTA